MRYVKIMFSLIFLTTLLFSCDEEFMERYPLDQISDETFWNTEIDLQTYNNRIYEMSRTNDQINIGYESNTRTLQHRANWTDTHACTEYFRDLAFKRSGKAPIPTSPQRHGYKGWNMLRAINYGLENYHRADISERIINRYKAEAKFFRGWFFSDKVQLFGDVPWTGKVVNIDDEDILYGPRMPREQAMENVLEDLNFAAENLPENWPGATSPSTAGRFNKWHALLIKARASLFEGTWRKYHGKHSDPEFWLREARDAAKEIIDNGPYEIYSTGETHGIHGDYRQMFTGERGHKLWDNPETMYWREYISGQNASTHMMGTYFHHVSGATKSFVDDYLMTDGKPPVTIEGVNPLYAGDKNYEDVFENRDPRMRQTLLHTDDYKDIPFFPLLDDPPWLLESGATRRAPTGYHTIKYWNWAQNQLTWGMRDRPAIILRYAEALLIYAEARAELGEITQSDLDITINKLRDRVAMPHLMLNDVPVDPRYTDVSPIIAEIRRERKIELAFEGIRYFDILRWRWGHVMREPDLGIRMDDDARERFPYYTMGTSVIEDPITGEMVEYVDFTKGTDYGDPIFEEKHYLWPINTRDLSRNPELKQNPGWE